MKKIISIILGSIATMFLVKSTTLKEDTSQDYYKLREKLTPLNKIMILDKSFGKLSDMQFNIAGNKMPLNFWDSFVNHLEKYGDEEVVFFSDKEFKKLFFDKIKVSRKIFEITNDFEYTEAELIIDNFRKVTKMMSLQYALSLMALEHFETLRLKFPELFKMTSTTSILFRKIHIDPLENFSKEIRCHKNYAELHGLSDDCDNFTNDFDNSLNLVFSKMKNKEIFANIVDSLNDVEMIIHNMIEDLPNHEKDFLVFKLKAISALSKYSEHEVGEFHKLDDEGNFLGSKFYESVAGRVSNNNEIMLLNMVQELDLSEEYMRVDNYLLVFFKGVELLRIQGKNVLEEIGELSEDADYYRVKIELAIKTLVDYIEKHIDVEQEEIEVIGTSEYKSEL